MDLETTGSHLQKDKIIEIGLVKIENLQVVDRLHYMVNPEMKVSPFILRLTSLSPTELAKSPKIESIIDEVVNFIGDSIIVAHNISFDLPFFNSVLLRLKRPELSNKSLCTQIMSEHLIPEILSTNLGYMSRIFNIDHGKAHRAYDDAQACALLLLNFLNILTKKNITKANQIYYARTKFKLNWAYFKRAEQDQMLETLKKINLSVVVHFKGENANHLAVVPLECPKDQDAQDFVLSVAEQVDYHTCSIKIVSSFFEALMEYNFFYSSIPSKINEMAVRYLNEKHLKGAAPSFDLKNYLAGVDSRHFLLTHHFIPEQLVLFPLFSLQHNNSLVFRFPAHNKRLFQYSEKKSAYWPLCSQRAFWIYQTVSGRHL